MDNSLEISNRGLLSGKFRVTKTSLTVEGAPTIEEYLEIGETLKKIEGAVMWWIGDWLNSFERDYGEKYSQALEATEYEYQTLKGAAWVSRSIEMVRRRTNLPWSHHKEVAALEPEEQEELLGQAEQEGWTRAQLRKAVKEHKKLPQPEIPEGKYCVIYADPPWEYDNSGFDQSAASHYQTMPVEDICNLPIKNMAAERAVLFLWVTNSFLQEGLEVCRAWGFDYKTNLVWIKNRGPGIGWFTQGRHELLFVAVRGEGMHPTEKPVSIIQADVSKHSKKPDMVYDLIEGMYEGPYIELFARTTRDGWKGWGNEI